MVIATSSKPIEILAVNLLAIRMVRTATVQASNVAVTRTINAEWSSSVMTIRGPRESFVVDILV